MTRSYRKARRAEAENETREKIVSATMALHVEQGVSATSYTDVATRAGVGAATVYRHFPTTDALIDACGAQFWDLIAPPTPDQAAATFVGLTARRDRIRRLVAELDTFYTRARGPLWSACRDQDRVAQLARFLNQVRNGVTALVAEALDHDPQSRTVRVVTALVDFLIWRSVAGAAVVRSDRVDLMVAIVEAAVARDESAARRARRRG
jgi:AcrR family transcriptional regulator